MKGLGRRGGGIAPLLLLILSVSASFGFDRYSLAPQQRERISPVLLQEVSFLKAHPQYDYPIPVIVKLEPGVVAQALMRAKVLRSVRGYAARLTGSQVTKPVRESDDQGDLEGAAYRPR